jgi:hypothetical protein
MTLAATQTNLLARVRFQSLRRQKLQLCSSGRCFDKTASSSPAAKGRRKTRGDPGSRTAPDDPLDRVVAWLAMTMIRRGHTISGRESGHFNGLRRHFRAARLAALDQDAVAGPIFAAFAAPHVAIHWLRAAMGGMALTEPDKRGSPSGLRRKNKYRTNLLSWQEIVGQELSPIPSLSARRWQPCPRTRPRGAARAPCWTIRWQSALKTERTDCVR